MEFQSFLEKKNDIVEYVRESSHALLNKLNELELGELGRFLSLKFSSHKRPDLYKCDLCHVYTSNTLKGMAAHKRGCRRKHTSGSRIITSVVTPSITPQSSYDSLDNA